MVGLTRVAFPEMVSLTKTAPFGAEAEKLPAENWIGEPAEIPIEPCKEASTIVFAPVIVESELVMELLEIKVADPEFVTVTALFNSDMPAFVPGA